MVAVSSTRTLRGCLTSVLLVCLYLLPQSVLSNELNCNYGLKPLWSSSLRNSPISATPLFFDVDGDGYGDIVVPSFSGEVWSIHGENGHIVDNWPFYLEDRAFHASPIVYDVNKDGVLEFLLTTSDAEIVFLHTNNSLLHGETIKIPPLHVRRYWYQLEKEYLQKLTEELAKQLGDSERLQMGTGKQRKNPPSRPPSEDLHKHTEAYSEFESRYGRYANPLYSRHQSENFITGLDPRDPEMVYVDPHVLATPTLADTNGDGLQNELVVPVSYYFEPFLYGDPHNLLNLGGLEQNELVNYVAGAIVVIDLNSGASIAHKLLGLTRASDTQPAYILSSPTIVRMFPGVGEAMVIVGTATGELHMLRASTLKSEPGFPISLDSMSAQVAVADLFHNGALELVVGDNSGNVYCIDAKGKTLWEFETREIILGSVRFVDLDGDSSLDVILVTSYGALWALHGMSGTPFEGFPIRLNTHVQSSFMLMHLPHSGWRDALSAVIPSMTSLFIVDLATKCVDSIPSDNMLLTVQSGDIDPYNAGMEVLAAALDGHLVCFATGEHEVSDYHVTVESWSGEDSGQNVFIHKSESFAVVLPWLNETVRDISGRSFTLDFDLLDNAARRSKEFSVAVTIGRKYLLYNGTLPAYQRRTSHSLLVPTPPEPIAAFLTVKVCNEYFQCESVSHHARFNLHYQDTLKWFLCVPFLALTTAFLWLLRDADFEPLPGAGLSSSARKNL